MGKRQDASLANHSGGRPIRGVASPPAQISLWDALKDLGWLPLLLMGLGGLSILDAAEKALAHDLTLILPLRSMLDGYHRVTRLMGDIVDPLAMPLVRQIGARFGWHLDLSPIWRPIFVIAMITVTGWSRALWHRGDHRFSIVVLAILTPSVLVGSLACALVTHLDGVRGQALLAILPIVSLWAATGVAVAVDAVLRREPAQAWRGLLSWAINTVVTVAVAGLLTVILYLPPQTRDHAGILVLGGAVAYLGVFYLRQGLNTGERFYSRLGLSILGGFVAAGVVLFADWLMRVMHVA